MIRSCDRLFTGGILFLIFFTPFAFGAVHPWAYATMEVFIFALLIVWMAKLAAIRGRRSEVGGQWGEAESREQASDRLTPHALPLTPVALPLALFIAFCAMQLMPLPPSFLQIISPQTFETYRQILPGWPDAVPYTELPQSAKSEEQGTTSTEQVRTVRGEGLGVSGNANNAERNNATNAKGQEQSAKSGEQRSEVGGQTSEGGDFELLNSTSAGGGEIRNSKSEIPASGSQLPALSSTPPSPSPLTPHASRLFPETWRPLSVSPTLSKIDLLKFAAFAALFFLVWRYPFEEPFDDFEFRSSDPGFFVLSPEQRFLRTAIFAVLGAGLLVAAVGFVERFTWNGKILWFFVPQDWGEARPNSIPRASGPFVNPDHFANYLSLIFPLALGGALFRSFMVAKAQQYGCQIFCGFTAFLLFTGILLSLSRGGWISALLGVMVLLWLSPWQRAPGSMLHAPRSKLSRVARLSLITVCLLLLASLFIVGSGGREQVDARLKETFVQDLGLAGRLDVWKDSLPMIRDFPILGVGLGAWSELFTRYESGPWSSDYYNDAHNDYVELLAETGVVGFSLLAVFFVAAGRRLVHGIDKVSAKNLPLLAGVLAALGGMALHSWLDFSLQIPANALLFTVLLALGLRLARGQRSEVGDQQSAIGLRTIASRLTSHASRLYHSQSAITPEWSEVRGQRSAVGNQKAAIRNSQSEIRNSGAWPFALIALRVAPSLLTPLGVSFAALALIACAVVQGDAEVKPVRSIAESKDRLLSRPTKASYHLSLVRRVGDKAPLDWQLSEYQAALWIQPTNPYIRDKYAATLIALGKTDEGLKEISRSVAESPTLDSHDYLSAESLPSLSVEEQNAVEAGFRQALARQYPQALNGLAEFYAKLDRHANQAALYEQAAQNESDKAKKAELLMNAGLAYLRAAASVVKGEELGVRGNATNAERNNATNAINATNAKSKAQEAGSKEQGAEDGSQRSEVSRQQSEIRNPKSEIRNGGPRDFARDAERLFRAAAAINPADPKPYQQLVTAVYAAQKDLPAAKDVIYKAIENGASPLPLYLSYAEAAYKGGSEEERDAALASAQGEIAKSIENGADPHGLYMTLAEGARSAGDRDREAAALQKALELQPASADTLTRLADVYSHKQNFDRAALYLSRIAKLNPDSADVHYRLAVAHEARYRFADAGRAYARAVDLAPGNANYRDRYEAFKARVEQNRKVAIGKSP